MLSLPSVTLEQSLQPHSSRFQHFPTVGEDPQPDLDVFIIIGEEQ